MTQFAIYNTKDLYQVLKVNRSKIHYRQRDGFLPMQRMLGLRSPTWSQAQINKLTK
jgi:predicted DNA-binding transcriptional regulator AlpA